jgi:hypothetical protein
MPQRHRVASASRSCSEHSEWLNFDLDQSNSRAPHFP